jgi:hypothetical protein
MSDGKKITREAENWRALIEVLDALLSEHISVTEGCRQVWRLASDLNQRSNKLFLPFVGVYSETDRFPLGEVRTKWSPAALVREDEERARVENHYKSFVTNACKALLPYARGRSSSESMRP